jgi:5-methylcytosine-specific restriction endonuclease McrA
VKRCPRCKVEIALEEFAASGYCKPCNRARVREWQTANPAKVKDNAARHREKHRARRNAESRTRYQRLMAEDPERVRKIRRDWAKTEKGIIANRLARHKRRGASVDAEAREYVAILLRDPCSYCADPAVEIDHIDPLALEGVGHWDNLTGSCRRCNAQKNDRPLLAYLAS